MTENTELPEQSRSPDCAVSSRFNFLVGAIAIALGVGLLYFAWAWYFG